MDGFFFNPSDFTDERLRSVMEGASVDYPACILFSQKTSY